MLLSVWVLLIFKCFIIFNEVSGLVGGTSFEPLLLTPFLKKGLIKTSQKLAATNIGNLTSYSAYFTVNEACESNLFFWFFKAEKDWQTSPVLLWLNGGPGSTSMFGLFEEEIGPWNHLKTGFVPNKYTWTKNFNILFIDQPVGTGYSFTNQSCYAENMTVVRNDMYSALVQFFTLFPELKDNKFFMVGESYAGMYIPAIAHEIDIQNPNASLKINLIGIIMGNPEIDMRCIYTANYLYELGIIDSITRDGIKSKFDEFNKALDAKNYTRAYELESQAFGNDQMREAGLPSVYNIIYDSERTDEFQFYIRNYKIRKLLHVGSTPFTLNSKTVADELLYYAYKSEAKEYITGLLKANKYIVGLYAGQLDVVCLYSSIPCVVAGLDWPGRQVYQQAPRSKWYVESNLAGWFKVAGNLWEVAVRKSGHDVPTDYGVAALDLITAAVADTPGTPLLTRLKTQA
uniref:Carboxypeptidase n=1 Tax=Graphocephala atropunctata TaxID=36148 RepID=A0A1B6KG38_9HEMI